MGRRRSGFDEGGTALTGQFLILSGFVAGPSTRFATTALPGGGMLVRRMDGASHAQALVVVDSANASVRPAPAWMAARRDVKLQAARVGKAYAVLSLAASGVVCGQRVELVAPDGTSCSAADYPVKSGTCDTLEVKLSADGTVVQQLPTALETTNERSGNHTCTWRWWPRAAQ